MPIVIGPCNFTPSDKCKTCGKSGVRHLMKRRSADLDYYTVVQMLAKKLLPSCS